MTPDRKEIIKSVFALLLGIGSMVAVSYYIFNESQGGAFGPEIMLVFGPVLIGCLILAWQYRSDLRKDPVVTLALPITGCMLCCIASLPQALGLYEFGFDSPRKFAGSVGIILLVQSFFWPLAAAYYNRLYQALKLVADLFYGHGGHNKSRQKDTGVSPVPKSRQSPGATAL